MFSIRKKIAPCGIATGNHRQRREPHASLKPIRKEKELFIRIAKMPAKTAQLIISEWNPPFRWTTIELLFLGSLFSLLLSNLFDFVRLYLSRKEWIDKLFSEGFISLITLLKDSIQ